MAPKFARLHQHEALGPQIKLLHHRGAALFVQRVGLETSHVLLPTQQHDLAQLIGYVIGAAQFEADFFEPGRH